MKPARIEPAAMALLLRQLAAAQRGGLKLPDALAILSRDPDLGREQARLVADLGRELVAGRAFSAALEAHPAAFARETVELVHAAETAGALAEALDLLAADYEQRALQRAAVRGALAWPALLAASLVVVALVIMVFVVPAFKEVFASFGADLPAPTLFLIALGDAAVDYWYVWVALIVAAAVYLVRGAALPGGVWIDRVLLRLPLVRPYLVRSFVSRVSRALAAAAESRLPLAHALAYLRATAGNRRLAESAAALEAGLREGKGLAAAVRAARYLPGQLAVALEIGERSNSVGPALRQLVAFSEADAARGLMRLQQAALVGMYLILGIIVAFIVIGLYLPIFMMGQAV